MKWQGILRRWLLAVTVGFVSVATSAGPGPRLLVKPIAETAFSSEKNEASADFSPDGRAFEPLIRERCTKSRLTLLWEDVALNPESAIALASLGNEYAEAGETELALQSFHLALDQLSTDPDLEGAARVRFRYSVEKRIRLLRDPGLSFAWTGQAESLQHRGHRGAEGTEEK